MKLKLKMTPFCTSRDSSVSQTLNNDIKQDVKVLHLSRFEFVSNLKWFRSTTRVRSQELVFIISCLLVVARVNTSLRCKLENNNKVTVLSQRYQRIY